MKLPAIPRWTILPLILLAAMFVTAAVVAPGGIVKELRFRNNVHAMNLRAKEMGGWIHNGRRSARYHVGVEFEGDTITDDKLPEIIAIVRECQARGLGDEDLYLVLNKTKVGDEGIKQLHGLSGLSSISLWETQVTSEGVLRLKQALPRTSIIAGLDR